jgi:hypothetical protein
MIKQTLTRKEIQERIMREARLRPDCNDVTDVIVITDANGWFVNAVIRDNEVSKMKEIDEIASELRSRYDLAA